MSSSSLRSINRDKPNFNAENVYRQLAENDLLPEAWGGQTITVNCSAVTGQGIPKLFEMLALQAEVLELKANPHDSARGTVLESEMHKGMGSVATVLVQNGTLRRGDAIGLRSVIGDVSKPCTMNMAMNCKKQALPPLSKLPVFQDFLKQVRNLSL